MKDSLISLAKKAWNDTSVNEKVAFIPSEKLKLTLKEIFGHDVKEIFITGSDIRHIKNHHSKDERLRGQRDITPEDIALVYETVNEFDLAAKERSDHKNNQTVLLTRDTQVKSFALLTERGKNKAEVKTFYIHEKTSPMSDAKIPEL